MTGHKTTFVRTYSLLSRPPLQHSSDSLNTPIASPTFYYQSIPVQKKLKEEHKELLYSLQIDSITVNTLAYLVSLYAYLYVCVTQNHLISISLAVCIYMKMNVCKSLFSFFPTCIFEPSLSGLQGISLVLTLPAASLSAYWTRNDSKAGTRQSPLYPQDSQKLAWSRHVTSDR